MSAGQPRCCFQYMLAHWATLSQWASLQQSKWDSFLPDRTDYYLQVTARSPSCYSFIYCRQTAAICIRIHFNKLATSNPFFAVWPISLRRHSTGHCVCKLCCVDKINSITTKWWQKPELHPSWHLQAFQLNLNTATAKAGLIIHTRYKWVCVFVH